MSSVAFKKVNLNNNHIQAGKKIIELNKEVSSEFSLERLK